MKEIQLTQGKVALVDDEDFEYLNQWKWHFSKSGYATRFSPRPFRFVIHMHRLVMNTPKNLITDHIDGDKLNNQKRNLRNCTVMENSWNQKLNARNTSGYKGVHFHNQNQKYQARIVVDGKKISLGMFEDIKDAAKAYDAAAVKYFKGFAKLNKDMGDD